MEKVETPIFYVYNKSMIILMKLIKFNTITLYEENIFAKNKNVIIYEKRLKTLFLCLRLINDELRKLINLKYNQIISKPIFFLYKK